MSASFPPFSSHFFRFLFLMLAFALIPASHAQNLVESYTTRLSEQDHFSSSGERLRSAAAIIRQDRANFHKFGRRDSGDQHDAFFSRPSNREALEQMINSGTSEPTAIRSIVNGTPMVRVSIFRTAPGRDFVNVEVAEEGFGDAHAQISSPSANELLASYSAHLSDQDHFSSSGERLRSAAAIIRQDRANFHKFGRRDPDDQHEAFFSSSSNREALERMLNRGKIDQSLSRMIIDGTPFVSVEIFRDSSGSPYITVTPFE
jgi:DnaJ-domain-containing protein 1